MVKDRLSRVVIDVVLTFIVVVPLDINEDDIFGDDDDGEEYSGTKCLRFYGFCF